MLMIVLMQKALMHVSNFGHFARLFIFFQYFFLFTMHVLFMS